MQNESGKDEKKETHTVAHDPPARALHHRAQRGPFREILHVKTGIVVLGQHVQVREVEAEQVQRVEWT